MPVGKKDIYGASSKSLYKAGTVAMERAAAKNREISAKSKMPNDPITRGPERIKMPAKQQVISTTKMFKPTPPTKKK